MGKKFFSREEIVSFIETNLQWMTARSDEFKKHLLEYTPSGEEHFQKLQRYQRAWGAVVFLTKVIEELSRPAKGSQNKLILTNEDLFGMLDGVVRGFVEGHKKWKIKHRRQLDRRNEKYEFRLIAGYLQLSGMKDLVDQIKKHHGNWFDPDDGDEPNVVPPTAPVGEPVA